MIAETGLGYRMIDLRATVLIHLCSALTIILYLRNKSWKPEFALSFNMGWRILVFYPEPEAREQLY
jgi:hypothetical protein